MHNDILFGLLIHYLFSSPNHTIRSVTLRQDRRGIVRIQILKSSSDYSILAEESGQSGILDTYWVIDPLDGTTNFARNIPFFCTSIALIKDNQVQIGVTLNPLTGECFYAEKGFGAFKNDQQIQVSS